MQMSVSDNATPVATTNREEGIDQECPICELKKEQEGENELNIRRKQSSISNVETRRLTLQTRSILSTEWVLALTTLPANSSNHASATISAMSAFTPTTKQRSQPNPSYIPGQEYSRCKILSTTISSNLKCLFLESA